MATVEELDALVKKTDSVVAETDRLLHEAEAQANAINAWREEQGLTGDVLRKFGQALTPDMRAQIEKEMEATAINDAHDLAAEVQKNSASADSEAARPKRGRNYV